MMMMIMMIMGMVMMMLKVVRIMNIMMFALLQCLALEDFLLIYLIYLYKEDFQMVRIWIRMIMGIMRMMAKMVRIM